MKGTDHFKRTIQMYLEQRAEEDTLFAKKYRNPAKNIDECVTHILNYVQNVGYAIVNVLGWIAVVLRKERVFLRTLFQIHLYRSLEMVCSFHIAVVFMSCQIVCFKISLQ